MNNSSEITPRTLESPLLEDFPVNHEDLLRKREQTEVFYADYKDDSGEQRVSTAFIPGNGTNKETLLVNVAWSDAADIELNLLRYATVAEYTGMDVVIVGFPGYDRAHNDTLTPLQLEDLVRSPNKDGGPSFSEVGKSLAESVKQLSEKSKKMRGLSYWKDREVTLLGYSQGVSSQLGMFEHLVPEIAEYVTDIYMWESADALKPQSKPTLFGKMGFESLFAGKAFKENELVFGEEASRELGIHDKGLEGAKELMTMMKVKGKRLTKGAPDAIAGSTQPRDLKTLHDTGKVGRDLRLHIVHGKKGIVSPLKQNERLVDFVVQKLGNPERITHEYSEEENHTFPNSLGRFAVLLDKSRK